MHKSFFSKKALWEGLSIIMISAIIGLLFNWQRTDSLPLSSRRPGTKAVADSVFMPKAADVNALPGPVADAAPSPEIHEPVIVSKSQILLLLKNRQVVIIDARTADEYRSGHIPGAVNVPAEDMYENSAVLDALPRDQWIVCYCDGPPCDLGELLASQLYTMGYPRVAYYVDGLDDWVKTQKTDTN